LIAAGRGSTSRRSGPSSDASALRNIARARSARQNGKSRSRHLNIETIAHNTRELDCDRALENFPAINLPTEDRAGAVCRCAELHSQQAAHALGRGSDHCLVRRSDGFTASALAARVATLSKQTLAQYGPTRAAYDLKKFRGQQIVQRIGHTRRYQASPAGLKAITALIALGD
jgi:hypothetical protein